MLRGSLEDSLSYDWPARVPAGHEGTYVIVAVPMEFTDTALASDVVDGLKLSRGWPA